MPDPESTLVLLSKAKAGDKAAMESLFERYVQRVRSWAHGRLPKWTRDLADTPDLVQDVLLQTFKRLEHFDPQTEDALNGYVWRAMMNRVRDELRRDRRRPDAVALDSALMATEPSPLDTAMANEAFGRYQNGLMRLSEAERDAVIGRLELGLTYAELSEFLGKPSPDAARKATERALARLAEEMLNAR